MISRVLFLLGLGLAPLFAQTTQTKEEPTPEQQLAIAQASITLPERAAWTIRFADAGVAPRPAAGQPEGADSVPPEPRPVSLEATRVGQVQRDVIKWSDGATSEAWWFGKVWLAEKPGVVGFHFNLNRWPGRVNVAAWIGRDSLRGIQSLGGLKCIAFEKEVPLFMLWPGYVVPDPSSAPLKVVAYVSLEGKKLVRVRLGDTTADFSWQPAPAGELVIPPQFAKRYQAITKALGSKLERAHD